jgi:hypothetical protein
MFDYFQARSLWSKTLRKFFEKFSNNQCFDLEQKLNNLLLQQKNIKVGRTLESASHTHIKSALLNITKNEKEENPLIVQFQNLNLYYKNCIFKISYENKMLNSLEVENEIYKNLIGEIIEKYSPFFVDFYGSIKCNENENIKNYLILESSNTQNFFGYKLSLFFKNEYKRYEPEEKKTIIWYIFLQLIWSLTVMKKLNLKHNDLHFGNIFLEENKEQEENKEIEEINWYVNYNNKYYTISPLFIVKIYDFDRGSAIGYPEIQRNHEIGFFHCVDYKQCNDLKFGYDMWSILFNFAYYGVLNDIAEHFPEEVLQNKEFKLLLIYDSIKKGVEYNSFNINENELRFYNKFQFDAEYFLPSCFEIFKNQISEKVENVNYYVLPQQKTIDYDVVKIPFIDNTQLELKTTEKEEEIFNQIFEKYGHNGWIEFATINLFPVLPMLIKEEEEINKQYHNNIYKLFTAYTKKRKISKDNSPLKFMLIYISCAILSLSLFYKINKIGLFIDILNQKNIINKELTDFVYYIIKDIYFTFNDTLSLPISVYKI